MWNDLWPWSWEARSEPVPSFPYAPAEVVLPVVCWQKEERKGASQFPIQTSQGTTRALPIGQPKCIPTNQSPNSLLLTSRTEIDFRYSHFSFFLSATAAVGIYYSHVMMMMGQYKTTKAYNYNNDVSPLIIITYYNVYFQLALTI